MAKNTSVILGDHFEELITNLRADGRYANASEVVRAGLRLLEVEEAKLTALRQALIEGEESGDAVELDVDRFLAEKRRKADAA
jgi:antitoxin ParD1/3/4